MQQANALIAACLSQETLPKNQAPAQTRPDFSARPRQTLTEAQRRFPLLRLAFEHIAEEVTQRKGRYLRRLDCIHASGSRTHQQTWDALKAMSGPILARMDMATLVLGWYNEKGELRLNRQRGIAEDSELSDSRVSRAFKALDRAGYTVRKIKRFYDYERGQWVTRVAIRLTYQFFTDLGLAHVLAKVQEKKKAQQQKKLQAAEGKRQQQKLNEDALKQIRKESHLKAQGKLDPKAPQQPLRGFKRRSMQRDAVQAELSRKRTEALILLQAEYPEATPEQLIEVINQRYPLS